MTQQDLLAAAETRSGPDSLPNCIVYIYSTHVSRFGSMHNLYNEIAEFKKLARHLYRSFHNTLATCRT